MHGAFLILLRLSGRWTLPAPAAWAGTMAATLLAWLAFYELRTDVLWAKLLTLFNPWAYGVGALRTTLGSLAGGQAFVLASLLALVAVTLVLEWRSVRRWNDPYILLRRPLALAGLVVLTVLLAPGKNNAFIYFAF
jgi:hypothetical protein